MSFTHYRKILLGGGAVAVAFSAPVLAQDAAEQWQGGLQEIVVTAQKREQRLQDVPVSITALGGSALEANRVTDVSALNAITPNLTVRETSGGVGLPSLTMRGALSIGVGPGADREVGFYVDGVYIGHAHGSMFELPDLERVEVLRGPQGTLFGRNATAGAISFITKNPKGGFAFKQEFTIGNYDQFRTKTRIDLPAVGPFSAAVTFLHTERRGEVRNLGEGTVWDFSAAGLGYRKAAKWLGSDNSEAVSAALRFDNGGAFTATYKFDWIDSDSTPVAIGFPGYGPDLGTGLAGMVALQPDPSILTPVSQRRPKAVNNAFTTQTHMKVTAHNLTADWQITDNLSLKNVFGYRKVDMLTSQDLGAFGGMVVPDAYAPGYGVPAGTPFIVYSSMTQFRHRQVSDELQLNFNSDPATVTAGLLYYHQKQASGGAVGLSNQFFYTPVPGYVLTCSFAPSCQGPGPTRGTSKAAYIQVEGHVTPQLDIVGGYRVTEDKKSGGFAPKTFRMKDTNSSYLIGANYKATDDVLLFAKYSTAFMSGGGNTGNFPEALMTYNPEKALSWEAGIKSDWLDHRLRVNLSLFTVKYKDVQFIIGGQTCGDPLEGLCVFTAGDARAKGAELEVTAMPVDGLTLSSGVGYTHFRYLDLSPIALATTGYFNPTYRPDWTVNLAAQYDTRPIDALGGGYLSFRIDGNYRSKMLLAAEVAPEYRSLVSTPGIWLLNGRMALTDFDLAGHKAEIALWGKNLTNDDHMSMVSSFIFMYPTTYERARTFGVDLKFQW